MFQQEFLDNVIEKIKQDNLVIGLAVAGSWITKEIDEYSDLDLVLVTSQKIAPNFDKMVSYAKDFGNLLNAFTGEHVGEKRLLICLFDSPLLHVDIKFLTTDEFFERVENPVIVWERDYILTNILNVTKFEFPYPNYQWIEDRFWTWVHYGCVKIGRGELFEAFDLTSFLRSSVISSLLHIKNNNLPRGLRKVEKLLNKNDLELLKETIPIYDKASIINSLEKLVDIYRDLRRELFKNDIELREKTEKQVMNYFNKIKLDYK
ncbi:MAG: aminoglycoside 6-adenylyltransferase [Candidatus Sericytochromatia bacterium]